MKLVRPAETSSQGASALVAGKWMTLEIVVHERCGCVESAGRASRRSAHTDTVLRSRSNAYFVPFEDDIEYHPKIR
jgi:hypothetical protein